MGQHLGLRWRAVVAIVAFVAIAATACGDSGGSSPAANPTVPGATGTVPTTTLGPVAGGKITILQGSEIAGLDPNALNGSAGAGGPILAAIFGGLVTYVAADGKTSPWLAKSLTPNADFTVWTLVLRDNMIFSDKSPFDAAAVKANWDRGAKAENKSPAFTYLSGFTSEVVDKVTLKLTLKTPDAHFDKNLSRRGSNYISSPASFAAGTDPSSKPVGAGPFVLQSWKRDDSMVLTRNPDYFDAPRPYLDQVTFKVLTAEDQRIDAFTTGTVDAFYTNIQGSADSAVAKVKGAVYNKVDTPDSIILMGNNRKAPFDDIRVRQLMGYAIDRKAAVDVAAKGSTPADNFTVANTIWFTADGALPKYDPVQAQKLVDAYVADKGPLQIKMLASSTNGDLSKFVQTSLNQLKNVKVDLELVDAVTFIGKVRGLDFQFVPWGLPWTDPDVSLATFFKSDVAGNYPGYKNAAVDAVLKTTSATADNTTRVEAYKSFFKQIATDLPVLPLWHGSYGYVTTPSIKGISVYEDGIPRLDGAWKAP